MTTKTQATVEDLYHVPENGKAEIVNGELVRMAPTGYLPCAITPGERNPVMRSLITQALKSIFPTVALSAPLPPGTRASLLA